MKGTKVGLEVNPGKAGMQTPPPRPQQVQGPPLPQDSGATQVASSPPSPTSHISKVNSTHQLCSPPQSENGCSESSQPTSGSRAEK